MKARLQWRANKIFLHSAHHSTDGMPVGDLNAFPDKKAEWEAIYGLATDSDKSNLAPSKFSLDQNYPNPFNPVTNLSYDLLEDSFVSITIYDMLGNVINNLVKSNQSSGFKSVQWNATNNQGEPVSAGVYLYSIEAGEFRQTKKMILLK